MRKIFASITILLFSIWILPLGVFIQPSKEKLACDGQRAICLCSHLIAKSADNLGQSSIKSFSSSHKEEGSSGSAGHYFLTATLDKKNNLAAVALIYDNMSLHTYQFFRAIEHIPKA